MLLDVLRIVLILFLKYSMMYSGIFTKVLMLDAWCIYSISTVLVTCHMCIMGCSIHGMFHDVFLMVHEAPTRYYSIAMGFFLIFFPQLCGFFFFSLSFIFCFLFYFGYFLFNSIFFMYPWVFLIFT